MALWRSGLTHVPLKDTFKGSNPLRVTTGLILLSVLFLILSLLFNLGILICISRNKKINEID